MYLYPKYKYNIIPVPLFLIYMRLYIGEEKLIKINTKMSSSQNWKSTVDPHMNETTHMNETKHRRGEITTKINIKMSSIQIWKASKQSMPREAKN